MKKLGMVGGDSTKGTQTNPVGCLTQSAQESYGATVEERGNQPGVTVPSCRKEDGTHRGWGWDKP